jgi:hypothetical protein
MEVFMVYLAKKNGGVVHHTDLAAMRSMDGIETPDLSISDEDFQAANGLLRIIGGEIFIGPTAEEQAEEARQNRIAEIDRALQAVDIKSARASRSVALAAAQNNQPDNADVQTLTALEAQAEALREELRSLTGVAG